MGLRLGLVLTPELRLQCVVAGSCSPPRTLAEHSTDAALSVCWLRTFDGSQATAPVVLSSPGFLI